jgi:hypothetical protein
MGTLATPKLEVLRREHPLAPTARRASKQPAGEHPIAEDGCRLPGAGLDAGVAPGIFRTETSLTAPERSKGGRSGR